MKVKSFTTNLEENKANTAKGGGPIPTAFPECPYHRTWWPGTECGG
ncbi:pinensin family lanthipeptide [Xanthovirga aplysinae]